MARGLFRIAAQVKPHRSYGPIMGPVVRWTGVAIGLSGFFLMVLGVLKADQIRSWWDADYVLAYLAIGSGAMGISHRMVRSALDDAAHRKP
jgi:hypothetical protein